MNKAIEILRTISAIFGLCFTIAAAINAPEYWQKLFIFAVWLGIVSQIRLTDPDK